MHHRTGAMFGTAKVNPETPALPPGSPLRIRTKDAGQWDANNGDVDVSRCGMVFRGGVHSRSCTPFDVCVSCILYITMCRAVTAV